MFSLFVLLMTSAQELICSYDNCDISYNNIYYELGIGDRIKYNNEIFDIISIERNGRIEGNTHVAWKITRTEMDEKEFTCPNDKGTGCVSTGSLFSPKVDHITEKCKKYYEDNEKFKQYYDFENLKFINIELKEDVGTRHKGNCGFNPINNKDNSVCLDWLEFDELEEEKDYNISKFENYKINLKNSLKEDKIEVLADYNYIFGIVENERIIENYNEVVAATRYEDKNSKNGYAWKTNKYMEQQRYQDLYISKKIPYWGGINKCNFDYKECEMYKLIDFEENDCKSCKLTYEIADYPCRMDSFIMLCNLNIIEKQSCVNVSYNNKIYCEERRKIIEWESKSQEIIDNRPDGGKKIQIGTNNHVKIFIALIIVIIILSIILTLICACIVGVVVLKFLI